MAYNRYDWKKHHNPAGADCFPPLSQHSRVLNLQLPVDVTGLQLRTLLISYGEDLLHSIGRKYRFLFPLMGPPDLAQFTDGFVHRRWASGRIPLLLPPPKTKETETDKLNTSGKKDPHPVTDAARNHHNGPQNLPITMPTASKEGASSGVGEQDSFQQKGGGTSVTQSSVLTDDCEDVDQTKQVTATAGEKDASREESREKQVQLPVLTVVHENVDVSEHTILASGVNRSKQNDGEEVLVQSSVSADPHANVDQLKRMTAATGANTSSSVLTDPHLHVEQSEQTALATGANRPKLDPEVCVNPPNKTSPVTASMDHSNKPASLADSNGPKQTPSASASDSEQPTMPRENQPKQTVPQMIVHKQKEKALKFCMSAVLEQLKEMQSVPGTVKQWKQTSTPVIVKEQDQTSASTTMIQPTQTLAPVTASVTVTQPTQESTSIGVSQPKQAFASINADQPNETSASVTVDQLRQLPAFVTVNQAAEKAALVSANQPEFDKKISPMIVNQPLNQPTQSSTSATVNHSTQKVTMVTENQPDQMSLSVTVNQPARMSAPATVNRSKEPSTLSAVVNQPKQTCLVAPTKQPSSIVSDSFCSQEKDVSAGVMAPHGLVSTETNPCSATAHFTQLKRRCRQSRWDCVYPRKSKQMKDEEGKLSLYSDLDLTSNAVFGQESGIVDEKCQCVSSLAVKSAEEQSDPVNAAVPSAQLINPANPTVPSTHSSGGHSGASLVKRKSDSAALPVPFIPRAIMQHRTSKEGTTTASNTKDQGTVTQSCAVTTTGTNTNCSKDKATSSVMSSIIRDLKSVKTNTAITKDKGTSAPVSSMNIVTQNARVNVPCKRNKCISTEVSGHQPVVKVSETNTPIKRDMGVNPLMQNSPCMVVSLKNAAVNTVLIVDKETSSDISCVGLVMKSMETNTVIQKDKETSPMIQSSDIDVVMKNVEMSTVLKKDMGTSPEFPGINQDLRSIGTDTQMSPVTQSSVVCPAVGVNTVEKNDGETPAPFQNSSAVTSSAGTNAVTDQTDSQERGVLSVLEVESSAQRCGHKRKFDSEDDETEDTFASSASSSKESNYQVSSSINTDSTQAMEKAGAESDRKVVRITINVKLGKRARGRGLSGQPAISYGTREVLSQAVCE